MSFEESETGSGAGTGFLVLVEYAGELPVVHATAAPSAGFLGASGWTGVGALEASLHLVHFKDQTAAGEFLRQRIESSEEPPQTPAIPPTVHHVAIQERAGKNLESADVGWYLSSVRILAAPGYGDVAAGEITETLESLQMVEGYAGHVLGKSVALSDEIWALILWNSPPLLPTPPSNEGAKIDHYRRIA